MDWFRIRDGFIVVILFGLVLGRNEVRSNYIKRFVMLKVLIEKKSIYIAIY